MDFSPNTNYPGSSRAIEMCHDFVSKSNYDDLCRPQPRLNEYFEREIDALYDAANAFSGTNQQQSIENKFFKCESNSTTTHSSQNSSAHTSHPISDGKKMFFTFHIHIVPNRNFTLVRSAIH